MEFEKQVRKYVIELDSFFNKSIYIGDIPERKLLEAMKYSLMSGGKRLRPILVIATYRLFKDDYLSAIYFAIAMEYVHTFSLIHDDLPAIDNDDFRHNKPTNHKVFGEDTAILAGDFLLNNAYKIISEDLLNKKNLENKVRAYNEFSNAVSKMLAGEYVDIQCEGMENISYELLEYMHQNKTGALIKASIKIGAILAGASKDNITKLSKYADKIGFAFQIKDDILSEIGDENILGKPIGNDKKMKKASFALIYGLDKANEVLEVLIKEAIDIANNFDKDSNFFKELALFIKNRDH